VAGPTIVRILAKHMLSTWLAHAPTADHVVDAIALDERATFELSGSDLDPMVDALPARVPGTVPLLVDTDGLVHEAGYANVWIVEGDAWITPPADRRILPGITPAAVLEGHQGAMPAVTGGAREEPIDLERLQRPDAVLLTSSIAGPHPARLVWEGRRP
jgi:Amino-transferase class IV